VSRKSQKRASVGVLAAGALAAGAAGIGGLAGSPVAQNAAPEATALTVDVKLMSTDSPLPLFTGLAWHPVP